MTYQIEVVTLKPQPVLVIEEAVAPDAIAEALARILPTVHGAASQLGSEITGMPFMRYLEMGEKFRIQAGVPVAERVQGADEITATELPGGKAATTVFHGPYHEVGAAWDAIDAWRKERGIAPAFGGWDIYENDPTEVSDPGELRTRLYQPLD
jgi:effector-binding domain-containing protein